MAYLLTFPVRLPLFWPILARSCTGMNLNIFNLYQK
jgi:hypothetical protein